MLVTLLFPSWILYFNSIKVQLELPMLKRALVKKTDFNSIKVQLEPAHGQGDACQECHFNSIKVQLELGIGGLTQWVFNEFQFHKGTIRTYYNIYQFRHIKFQFHKGTIRTIQRCFLSLFEIYFNSIKVQLELNPLTSSFKCNPYFNSIKVQLEL